MKAEPKRGWKIVAALLGVTILVTAGAGIALAMPRLARRMEFFRVRRVELVGVRHLPPRAVVAALRLRAGASVFDELAPMERRLAAVPGVRQAAVRRRLPGALRVEVVEAIPVALAPRAAGMALVDSAGRVLPFDPTRAAPDLPVLAQPDSLVARLLGHVRDADPGLFAQISSAWRVADDVVLDVGGRRVWFRPDASPEEMHAVMAVAQDLARKGRPYAELDGRFAGQVVVRWSRA
jgi:cell division septal protein FtsQ